MGNVKNILSFILFCLFLASYISKLFMLYKRDHIKANVLGKSGKKLQTRAVELSVKTTTFAWGLSWLLFSVAESRMDTLTGQLWSSPILSLTGLLFAFAGLLLFILAMRTMRTSWRVGIDKSRATELITSGVYKYSRNLAFVGFDCMFLGLFLLYPNLFTLILLVLNLLFIHLLILQEEKHLSGMAGAAYIQYTRETPRYIFLLGGLGNEKP